MHVPGEKYNQTCSLHKGTLEHKQVFILCSLIRCSESISSEYAKLKKKNILLSCSLPLTVKQIFSPLFEAVFIRRTMIHAGHQVVLLVLPSAVNYKEKGLYTLK